MGAVKQPRPRPEVWRPYKPILHAYGIGLLSTIGPRAIGVLITVLRRKTTIVKAAQKLYHTLKLQLAVDEFPFSCALTIAGVTLIPNLIYALLKNILLRLGQQPSKPILSVVQASIRLISSFVTAIISFNLLNRSSSLEEHFNAYSKLNDDKYSKSRRAPVRRRSDVAFGPDSAIQRSPPPPMPMPLAGKTLDITFFALTRAADVIAGQAWDAYKNQRKLSEKAVHRAEWFAAPATFATSCMLIMWCWFYHPHDLPPQYNDWITTAADVDPRLIEALRQCRYGNFLYGQETGMAPLLASMCKDLNYPVVWGDPAKTIPVPETLYHSGAGPICEVHAASRFWRSWIFAMRMYLPLNMLLLVRGRVTPARLLQAFRGAAQSSAFLGTFIMLFYYGVCLGRKRIVPPLLGPEGIFSKMRGRTILSRQQLDSGVGTAIGCFLCGWSIFFEQQARRKEMAFFVAPRAVATLFPRRYERKYIGREQFAFASSVAIVLSTAASDPKMIKGVFGRLLGQILH